MIIDKLSNLRLSFVILLGFTGLLIVMILAALIYGGICNLDSSRIITAPFRSNASSTLTGSGSPDRNGDPDILEISNSFGESFGTLTSILEPRISAKISANAERRRLANENRVELAQKAKEEMLDKSVFVNDTIEDEEVDWTLTKDEFVAVWTERIDNYLQGTPLEGNGAHFATASWDTVVDPRWSPAISNTESSKGSHCFLPYNAWGWGDSSFSSWEEAINYHVAHLKEGYQYTISPSAAEKYCPPSHESWYDKTLNQMKMI